MLILAVDSSTKSGSASLISQQGLIGEKLIHINETHSQHLMPLIVDLIESCQYSIDDLEGVGVSLGPGSFTGTRIGLSTAKTLAQTLDIPIVGVSTLEAMAYGLRYSSTYICPMIDARRDRVFTSLYRANENLTAETEEAIVDIKDLLNQLEGIEDEIYFIGKVVSKHKNLIKEKIDKAKFVMDSFNLPRAGFIGEMALKRLKNGEEDNLFALKPNYLKRSQAEIQWEKKHS